MQPMTETEQRYHRWTTKEIRDFLPTLRAIAARLADDEDIQVAYARLDNWLRENDGRWVR